MQSSRAHRCDIIPGQLLRGGILALEVGVEHVFWQDFLIQLAGGEQSRSDLGDRVRRFKLELFGRRNALGLWHQCC